MQDVKLNDEMMYQVILARDGQYDDQFFFAVTTTRMYCRPSCPARRPLRQHCLFFDTRQAAKAQGFRSCKRCHPDKPKDFLLASILRHIEAGDVNQAGGINKVAASVRLSAWQLRRLDTAKELIVNTELPIIDIAYSSDFSSVRQLFNNTFKQMYNVSPRVLRNLRQI